MVTAPNPANATHRVPSALDHIRREGKRWDDRVTADQSEVDRLTSDLALAEQQLAEHQVVAAGYAEAIAVLESAGDAENQAKVAS